MPPGDGYLSALKKPQFSLTQYQCVIGQCHSVLRLGADKALFFISRAYPDSTRVIPVLYHLLREIGVGMQQHALNEIPGRKRCFRTANPCCPKTYRAASGTPDFREGLLKRTPTFGSGPKLWVEMEPERGHPAADGGVLTVALVRTIQNKTNRTLNRLRIPPRVRSAVRTKRTVT